MILEICVDSIQSAVAAEQGGAQRIEICSSLLSGGTTPSFGLVRQCIQNVGLPAMAMIRPHDGGFVYDEDDLRIMFDDIDAIKELGVHGVVVGALTHDGDVDVDAMERLIHRARPLQVTFHRAFDTVRDPWKALDTIIDLGVDRLLTSGQKASAEQGVLMIRQLAERAAGRLDIMAGAGIDRTNVRRIADVTQVREIHASASVPRLPEISVESGEVHFGDGSRLTSASRVRQLVEAMS